MVLHTVQLSNNSISDKSVYHQNTVLTYTQLTEPQSIVYTQLNVKSVIFQIIKFSISTGFSSIWPTERTLSSATSLGQSGPGSNGNVEILRIPQSSSLNIRLFSVRTLLGIVLPLCRDAVDAYYILNWHGHPGPTFGEFYPSAEMQSVYSTASADCTMIDFNGRQIV